MKHSDAVLPQHNQRQSQCSPCSEIDSTSDAASHIKDSDKQVIALDTLYRSKEEVVPPVPLGSVQVNSSQESLDLVYSEVELREPLLGDDLNH